MEDPRNRSVLPGTVGALLREMDVVADGAVALAGDASTRCFFRCHTTSGSTVVVTVYPPDGPSDAERDVGVQRWAAARGLPVPPLVAVRGGVVVSEDLGDRTLGSVCQDGLDGLMEDVLVALAAFQRCHWQDAPTAPFDAAFFRRELQVFEDLALRDAACRREAAPFLDDLSARLAEHPFRLLHRDFHVDNLLLHQGRVWAVDFQDLRAGPDTYDLASLLRERAGADTIADEWRWVERASRLFAWEPGWQSRYLECASQRGMKVLGTFLRLAARGRPGYLRFLPPVQRKTSEALQGVGAPATLVQAVSGCMVDGGV